MLYELTADAIAKLQGWLRRSRHLVLADGMTNRNDGFGARAGAELRGGFGGKLRATFWGAVSRPSSAVDFDSASDAREYLRHFEPTWRNCAVAYG